MFDTLEYTKKLEAVGLSRAVAEAHVQLHRDLMETQLVTKTDFREGMKDLEHRLTVKIASMFVVGLGLAVTVLTLVIQAK